MDLSHTQLRSVVLPFLILSPKILLYVDPVPRRTYLDADFIGLFMSLLEDEIDHLSDLIRGCHCAYMYVLYIFVLVAKWQEE
jgi:hypothetical protein